MHALKSKGKGWGSQMKRSRPSILCEKGKGTLQSSYVSFFWIERNRGPREGSGEKGESNRGLYLETRGRKEETAPGIWERKVRK